MAMSSPRRSPRASSGNRLASKRQRVDELQKLIAAEQVAVQGASSKTRELNDARRILEAANQYSRLTTVLDAVTGLPDGQGEQLLTDHADADRSRKSRLTQLEAELSAALERQHRLRARLDQLRERLPPADQARQQLRRAQNDTAVQRDYTELLQSYGDITNLYNMLEKLMVVSDYPWLESDDWMQRIRPAYHALAPPSHVLRNDLATDSESSAGGGGGGSDGSSPP